MSSFELADMVDTLLSDQHSFSSQISLMDQFAEHCRGITGVIPDPTFDAWADDTELNSGVAINPQAAAFCIKDYARTLQFIRGIFSALKDIKDKPFLNTRSVLYAGCGPFATLLLPILSKLELSNFEFHLIDIHPESLKSVRTLLDHFELNHANITLHLADACEFESEQSFDVIIAETMQKALEQEPQVNVTKNLAKYLSPTGIFIPQTIELQLWLAHWELERQEIEKQSSPIQPTPLIQIDIDQFDRIPITKKWALSINNLINWKCQQDKSSQNTLISFSDFQTPAFNEQESFDILLSTEIQVYGSIWLREYDCELTLPYKFYEISPAVSNGRYQLSYELGQYPHFNITS